MSDRYYNYISFYRGIPVYVGKGIGDRWLHTIDGKSSNELINDFYFRSKYLDDLQLDTYIFKEYDTENEALDGEKVLINKYLPYCNKCIGRFHDTDLEMFQKIQKVSESVGFDKPEELQSKFDFRFLFTPKGLLCKSQLLSQNSPFEYAEENYHIRIKKELLKFFPENFLQFMKKDNNIGGRLLTSMHTKLAYTNIMTLERGNLFNGLEYDSDWLHSALLGGSLDFAESFGFVNSNENIEKFLHNYSSSNQHVKDYNSFMKDKSIKDEKLLKKKVMREKNTESGWMRRLQLKWKHNPKFDNIRVRMTNEVVYHLHSLGFEFSGKGNWINLSISNKPYLSMEVMNRFTNVKQEELFLLDLKHLKNK